MTTENKLKVGDRCSTSDCWYAYVYQITDITDKVITAKKDNESDVIYITQRYDGKYRDHLERNIQFAQLLNPD